MQRNTLQDKDERETIISLPPERTERAVGDNLELVKPWCSIFRGDHRYFVIILGQFDASRLDLLDHALVFCKFGGIVVYLKEIFKSGF